MAERKMVAIDAGHGGADPGATYQGRQEKDDNLKLAVVVGSILADNGVDVRYTRTDDTYNTPLERAMMANNAEADYFISIHRNAMPTPGTGSGIETIVFEEKGIEGILAKNIGKELNNSGFTNLGTVERPGLVVLRRTKMPSILVEVGYIDNESDNEIFDEKLQEIAKGIATGILNSIKEQEETEPEYYQVQTGAYQVHTLAEKLVDELKAQGFPAFVVYEDGLYKVRAGAFQSIDNAVRMEQALRQLGYNTFMVKRPAVY